VRSALASDAPPKHVRAPAGSSVAVFEPRVRGLLKAYPRMPVTAAASRPKKMSSTIGQPTSQPISR
jgi:hypothetical protein